MVWLGLGIGPGDEVIVPAFTFMATALAALAVGAIPIVAEIDESLTLDPQDLERRITPRTKAVIPVHMCGLPCDMDAIMQIARRHNLMVLEDACQADGGSYKDRKLGSIGVVGAFSFNQFKIITCGEGGALVTNDQNVHERALIHHDGGCVFRDHASRMKVPFFAGWNFRMNEILSAILRVQLKRLDGILASLRTEKRFMMSELENERAFSLSPIYDKNGDCAVALTLLFESTKRTRAFLRRLDKEGIAASCLIDSDRHVYVNWEPLLKQRGAHHPRRDAFRLTTVPPKYSPEMCPRTLSILGRTVRLDTSATRAPEDLRTLMRVIKKVAGRS